MKLERYIKLSNGKCREVKTLTVSDYTGIQRTLNIGDEIPEHAYFSAFADIIATSTDIWGLARGNWFTLNRWGLPIELAGFFEIEDDFDLTSKIVANQKDLESFLKYYSVLFAPIYENGEIIRYERVWKRKDSK